MTSGVPAYYFALYPSLEVRDTVLKTGMERGAAISYDRLEEVVARLKGRS